MEFLPGQFVECKLTEAMQNSFRARDARKAKKEKVDCFIGCAAAYMHLDESYLILSVTKTGGLKLRGFVPTVSPKDVRLSTKSNWR